MLLNMHAFISAVEHSTLCANAANLLALSMDDLCDHYRTVQYHIVDKFAPPITVTASRN